MPLPLGEMILNELRALHQVVTRARRPASLARERCEDQDLLWGSVVLNVADFYAGVERTLHRVAGVVDGEVPGGPHADTELLRQMVAERPGVRPAVLSKDTVEALEEFRRIRRLVVDGRSSELDALRLAPSVAALEGVFGRVRDELLRFVIFLEQEEHESEKRVRTGDEATVDRASGRPDQRELEPSIRGLMEELAAGLGEIYGGRLRGVYLFGSRARGDADPDSDVDVLVVLDQVTSYGTEIDRTGQLVAALSLKYGVSVSRVFTSEQDWAEGRGAFLRRLRREAIPVVRRRSESASPLIIKS
ncbi:MAG TPA: hypothetical protein GX513_10520 [Firmicutes bacterium]|nr:hypothetical protein [Bacillota bacterium]